MKLSLGFFSVLVASVYAEYEKDEGVLVLGGDNFEAAVKEYDYLLAEFYAPWCGHCKSLAPEYAKAAQKLADKENIALAKIDATEHGELAKKYGVRGYPTLKWFKKDPENALEYGGGRKEPEIVSWIEKKTGPSAVNLENVEAANKFKEENEVCVVGYFPEGSDSSAFIAAADSVDDINFAITADEATAKELDLAAGGITLFKKFDEGFNKYEEGEIAEFVKTNMLAYVTEFSDKTAPKVSKIMKFFCGSQDHFFSISISKFQFTLFHFYYPRSSAATSKNTPLSSPLLPVPTTKKTTPLSPPLPKNTEVLPFLSSSTATNPITAESSNSLVLKKKTVPL